MHVHTHKLNIFIMYLGMQVEILRLKIMQALVWPTVQRCKTDKHISEKNALIN